MLPQSGGCGDGLIDASVAIQSNECETRKNPPFTPIKFCITPKLNRIMQYPILKITPVKCLILVNHLGVILSYALVQ